METKAVTYIRLMDSKEHFVGFKRTIVEYLPAGEGEWQLEPIKHNDRLSANIDKPPHNIISMKRPIMTFTA